jgi:hypothetical protein
MVRKLKRRIRNRHYGLWVSTGNRALSDMNTERLMRVLANPLTVAFAAMGFVLATVWNSFAG